MRIGILGYIPPPTFGHPLAFMRNLEENMPKNELLFYSDHDWANTIKLRGSPETAKHKDNQWAINNSIFFTGLRIAVRHGLTHFIYVESDCRFGRPGWDEVLLEEFFSIPKPCAIGGTMVCYNPCNAGMSASRRWQEALAKNVRRNFPIATYGFRGAAQTGGTSVFVNGALGIYSVAWLTELFPQDALDESIKLSLQSLAWDFEIGSRLWTKMGEEAYDVVGHLDSIYSGYGDQQTTESERLKMLANGDVVAVHQVKSDV